MAETDEIEELKKLVRDADADTILKLQKIVLDKITGPTGGIEVAAKSCSSCTSGSCHTL